MRWWLLLGIRWLLLIVEPAILVVLVWASALVNIGEDKLILIVVIVGRWWVVMFLLYWLVWLFCYAFYIFLTVHAADPIHWLLFFATCHLYTLLLFGRKVISFSANLTCHWFLSLLYLHCFFLLIASQFGSWRSFYRSCCPIISPCVFRWWDGYWGFGQWACLFILGIGKESWDRIVGGWLLFLYKYNFLHLSLFT